MKESKGIRIAFVRHAPTAWNEAGRIQGHSDQPLSESGIKAAQSWLLPVWCLQRKCLSSPLQRARQTAELLDLLNCDVAQALIEMNWGDWEGKRLAELRESLGKEMAKNEARGLDFQPPGGESPRMVQERLRHWFKKLSRDTPDLVGVAHKGVIRAAYALASGWDMVAEPPHKLRYDCLHDFVWHEQSGLNIVKLNIETR